MLPFVLHLFTTAFRYLSYICVVTTKKFVITELINIRKASWRRVAEQMEHKKLESKKGQSEIKNCLRKE